MTVKDRVGRPRYVAFRVAQSTSREKAARLLPEGAKLTRFDGTFGIVRVAHTEAAPLVQALNEGGHASTIATSGTLAGAARRLPPQAGAAKRGPRPPRDQGKA